MKRLTVVGLIVAFAVAAGVQVTREEFDALTKRVTALEARAGQARKAHAEKGEPVAAAPPAPAAEVAVYPMSQLPQPISFTNATLAQRALWEKSMEGRRLSGRGVVQWVTLEPGTARPGIQPPASGGTFQIGVWIFAPQPGRNLPARYEFDLETRDPHAADLSTGQEVSFIGTVLIGGLTMGSGATADITWEDSMFLRMGDVTLGDR